MKQLTPDQMIYGCSIGTLRFTESKKKNLTDRLNSGGGDCHGLFLSQVGSCGEYAFCLIHGMPWPASVNSFDGAPDAPPDWEIRTTEYSEGKLILRKRDNPTRRFALMTCDFPRGIFTYRGWMHGVDMKQKPWFVPGSKEQKKEPCYMVPQGYLKNET